MKALSGSDTFGLKQIDSPLISPRSILRNSS